jgi:hypothetical protein
MQDKYLVHTYISFNQIQIVVTANNKYKNRRCPKQQQVQSGECSNVGKLTRAAQQLS